MAGTKQRTPSVRTAVRTRRHLQGQCKVFVPMVAWQNPRALYVKHEGQRALLKTALKAQRVLKTPHTILVHDVMCPYSVFVWPRRPDESDDLYDTLDEVHEHCRCVPIVMYTGARA